MKSFAKHGMTFAICLTLALSGCSGKKTGDGKGGDKGGDKGNGGAATIDQSSPEKVAEAFKKAAADKDWKTMFTCSTDNAKMILIMGPMSRAEGVAFSDASKKESLDAILKKHGIDPTKKPGPDDDPMAGVKDKAALFADLTDWLDKNRPKSKNGKPRPSMVDRIANTEFNNFKTTGDTATAEMSSGGRKMPIDFKKIDGKWYVHIDLSPRAPSFPKKKAG
jgi:hypothetical protein